MRIRTPDKKTCTNRIRLVKMLCDAICDAGGPNQLADHHWKSGTLYSPWHPDKGYPFKNAPSGAFFLFGFPCPVDFCFGYVTHAGRAVFIVTGACNSNPNPPHAALATLA